MGSGQTGRDVDPGQFGLVPVRCTISNPWVNPSGRWHAWTAGSNRPTNATETIVTTYQGQRSRLFMNTCWYEWGCGLHRLRTTPHRRRSGGRCHRPHIRICPRLRDLPPTPSKVALFHAARGHNAIADRAIDQDRRFRERPTRPWPNETCCPCRSSKPTVRSWSRNGIVTFDELSGTNTPGHTISRSCGPSKAGGSSIDASQWPHAQMQ